MSSPHVKQSASPISIPDGFILQDAGKEADISEGRPASLIWRMHV
ncbi:hypothetical protein SC09_contig4orf00059 [Bacillus subtilis]|uniref:Uncharacterized protein n=1 Tax=Bacillus subtilis TaxID=1423 RepID=A0A0D1I8N3_BACIU|nr:hypothetical protein SC09_contig4orf00059 [Bacillus subtilis]